MDFSAISPDLVYLLLVFGLWTGVTAAYVAGTGVLEFLSLGTIAVAILAMTQMDTNWFAVMAIVVGISAFIVTPFIEKRYTPYALVGLAIQAFASLFLFGGEPVSLLIIAMTVVVPLIYYQFALIPLQERAREQPDATRDEQMIGKRGVVMNTLDPMGTVNVDSELWTAISEDEHIEAGREIIVVDREGLKLIVEPIKRKVERLALNEDEAEHNVDSYMNGQHQENMPD